MQQLTYIVSGTADAQRKAEQAKAKLDRIPHIESLLITIAAPCEMPCGSCFLRHASSHTPVR